VDHKKKSDRGLFIAGLLFVVWAHIFEIAFTVFLIATLICAYRDSWIAAAIFGVLTAIALFCCFAFKWDTSGREEGP
jgi:hypothetical protein